MSKSSVASCSVAPSSNQQSHYKTVDEAAQFLGLSKWTVYKRVHSAPYETDPIPFAKFSKGCLRFPAAELAAWAERRQFRVTSPKREVRK